MVPKSGFLKMGTLLFHSARGMEMHAVHCKEAVRGSVRLTLQGKQASPQSATSLTIFLVCLSGNFYRKLLESKYLSQRVYAFSVLTEVTVCLPGHHCAPTLTLRAPTLTPQRISVFSPLVLPSMMGKWGGHGLPPDGLFVYWSFIFSP